jgi:Peptidase family M48
LPFPIYLSLLLGIALALAAPFLAGRLPPRARVWSLSTAAVVAAAGWIGSLFLIVLTGLGRDSAVARFGHWSAAQWRLLDPIGVWIADAAGLILALCLLSFIRAAVREARAAAVLRRLADRLPAAGRVVFVDDEVPHAYAIGGPRPRIVLSRGLLRSLSAAERRAVISHEIAHLEHHHHHHLRVIRLAVAAHPLLRWCEPAGVRAVERWADEESAFRVGDRTLVARTLLRAALAGIDHPPVPAGVLAHSAVDDVGDRVRALMTPPPRLRLPVAIATCGLLAATVAAPCYAADNLDARFQSASTPAGHHA